MKFLRGLIIDKLALVLTRFEIRKVESNNSHYGVNRGSCHCLKIIIHKGTGQSPNAKT